MSKILRLIFVSISVLLMSYSLWLFTLQPLKVDTLQVVFIIGDRVGVDVNSNEINFGMVPPGGRGVRNILVTNSYNFNVSVRILVSKSLEPYLQSEKAIVIPIRKTSKIPIILMVPSNATFGNYSGVVKLEFRKA